MASSHLKTHMSLGRATAGFDEQRRVRVDERGHVKVEVSFAGIIGFGVEVCWLSGAKDGSGNLGVRHRIARGIGYAEMQSGALPSQPGFRINQFYQ